MFGSKLVSCDAAGLPFGMVSEPRRRLEPTLAGSLVEYLAVKMYFRVSAESFSSCASEPRHAHHSRLLRFLFGRVMGAGVAAVGYQMPNPPVSSLFGPFVI